jgi:thiol-disulfide isomerase/thioredoxin
MRPLSFPRITLLFLVVLGLFLLGAGPPTEQPDLMGRITIAELYRAFPVFREDAEAYHPQTDALRTIGRTRTPTRIVAFLGTWCLASQGEIPALLKTLELAANPGITLEIYAVDHYMDDGTGLAATMGVVASPTVVVFQGGREVGRIRGLARESMEEDLARILDTARVK